MKILDTTIESILENSPAEHRQSISDILENDRENIQDLFLIDLEGVYTSGIILKWSAATSPNLKLFPTKILTAEEQLMVKSALIKRLTAKSKFKYLRVLPDEMSDISCFDRHLRMEREIEHKGQKVKVDFGCLLLEEYYADNQVIVDLHDASFDGETYMSVNWQEIYGKSDFKKINGYNLALFDGRLLIGIVIVNCLTDCNHIISLAIAPQYKNQGLGRKIMQELFNRMPNKKWRLGVYENNTAGLKLYRSLGFEIIRTNGLVWKIR